MSRLATLTREKMAPAQREGYDRIVESRSRVPQDGVHDVVYEPLRPNADGSLGRTVQRLGAEPARRAGARGARRRAPLPHATRRTRRSLAR